ncbi:MAG: polysaccharide export protein [Candidatus Competibacteraceae bacterium]
MFDVRMNHMKIKRSIARPALVALVFLSVAVVSGCATNNAESLPTATYEASSPPYVIAPGDNLDVFVWDNPQLSTEVQVRPDGKVTTPLAEDVQASGKTPNELAREIERLLSRYVLDPVVTVKVTEFVGRYSEQIRIVGEAARPQSLPFRESMTALDVMIAVGGFTEFADGNRSTLVRSVDGEEKKFRLRLDDLVNDGDISANVDMLPGDVLIIPEAWF